MATMNGMTDVNAAREMGRQAVEQGRQAVEQGYETMRDYAEKSADMIGDVSGNLKEFVAREPWVALIAAFAVGYLVARALRRVPS
ncbi:MAG TPA: hypothetical protein VMB26_07485 [Candidatus Binataceae bacterium]|nr:hypothetical protein [Candidatus Binataceae bacterium]